MDHQLNLGNNVNPDHNNSLSIYNITRKMNHCFLFDCRIKSRCEETKLLKKHKCYICIKVFARHLDRNLLNCDTQHILLQYTQRVTCFHNLYQSSGYYLHNSMFSMQIWVNKTQYIFSQILRNPILLLALECMFI